MFAVGDIDAFIKTTRPDGKDEVGKSTLMLKWISNSLNIEFFCFQEILMQFQNNMVDDYSAEPSSFGCDAVNLNALLNAT